MKKPARDYSQLLIVAAILVTVARYVGAFLASDLGEITGWMSSVMTALMAVTGLGMGVLDVLGSAYVFEGWRAHLPGVDRKWSNRFRVQTVFVLALFVSGIGILVPFTVSRVQHVPMGDVFTASWMLWGWAVLVNVAPYLLIGGVVTSQAGVVGIAKPPVANANGSDNVATGSETPATSSETFTAVCDYPGCSWSHNHYATPQAARNAQNAHAKVHANANASQ